MPDNRAKPKINNKTPVAGCKDCGAIAWILVLDKFPPFHQKITHFVCAGCRAWVVVDMDISDMKSRAGMEEVVTPSETS